MKYFASLLLLWIITVGASENHVESNMLNSQKTEIEVSECSSERAKAYKTLEGELLKVQFSIDLTSKTLTIQSDVGIRNFDLSFNSSSNVTMTDKTGTKILATWQLENNTKILKFKEDESLCFAYWVYF